MSISVSGVSAVISAQGGGSTYTEGFGIDITNNEISIDPNVVALASTVPSIELNGDSQVTAIDGHTLAGGGSTESDQFVAKFTVVALETLQNPQWFGTTYEQLEAAYEAGKRLVAEIYWATFDTDHIIATLDGFRTGNVIKFSGVIPTNNGPYFGVIEYHYVSHDLIGYTNNMQADWNISSTTDPGYIKHKPSIPEIELNADSQVTAIDGHALAGGSAGSTYTAGDYISIQNDVIAVTGIDPSLYASQSDLEAVSGLITPELPVVAGDGIDIQETNNQIVISSTVSGSTYTSGTGIDITNDVISVDNTVAMKTDIPELPEEEEIEFEDLDLSDYALISDIPVVTGYATKSELEAVSATIPELPDEEEVEFEEIDFSDYALASAIPDISNLATKATTLAGYGITDAYTKSEVNTSLNGKQSTLTGITDVQVVNSLPGSPVSTVLYLIPEV